MGQRAVIDFKKIVRELNKSAEKIAKMENIATVRSINVIAERSKTMIAKDVKEDTGAAIGTVKRRIITYKASRSNIQATLFMKDTRLTYPKPRQLKKGASFLALGKKRVKKTTRVKMKGTGSIPFVATLPSGGTPGGPKNKKAAVYVRPGYTDETGGKKKGSTKSHPRRISTMLFSSLPHLARKNWKNKVQKFAVSEFRKEYPNQLKKAKHTGRF